MTPTKTAMAKSSNTVTVETTTKIKASFRGILLMILKLLQANVPMTTMNITPTKAAIGICSMTCAPNNTKQSSAIAATIPDKRPRPPELTLMIDCPIIAQPPIPPKRPLRILAAPWAKHSRFPLPRVSVISSIKFKVINDSISPTAASKKAVDKIRSQCPFRVPKSEKISNWNWGKLPCKLSPPPSRINDPTVLTSIPPKMVIQATTIIAVKAAGIFVVNLGRKYMIPIVRATKASMI